jgi:hypothetical protein
VPTKKNAFLIEIQGENYREDFWQCLFELGMTAALVTGHDLEI